MRIEEYEEKLYHEIIVDCKDEYEQNMSWYYYAQDELDFPFKATIKVRKRDGSESLKKVKVVDLSPDTSNFYRGFDLKVDIEFDDYIVEIPLSKLDEVKSSERTEETIKIWQYWIKK